MKQDAAFTSLRAVGAFLVSATLKNGSIEWIQITSEAGGVLKIIVPWKTGGTLSAAGGTKKIASGPVELPTVKGERIVFQP